MLTDVTRITALQAFREMEMLAANLDVEDFKVDSIVRKIGYFVQQTLCDLDRRAKVETLRSHWLEFEKLCGGTKLFERARADEKLWPVLLSFVGVKEAVQVKRAPPLPELQRSQSAEAGPVGLSSKRPDPILYEFFRILNEKVYVSPKLQEEREFLRIVLLFLAAECQLASEFRNITEEVYYWKMIQPLLSKAGILDAFREDELLRKRVLNFFKPE